MQWTQQQWDAITDRGHSLIVCAAAGSGKTAVLVERIVQLVAEGCPIEQMLVVTFTNAAAGEMRQRIGEALLRAAQADRQALSEQLLALPRASISTLHRFCGGLLREHFQALGVDPGFRIGDEQECGVLAHQAMEDALYACYEVGSADFLAADACYTQEELCAMAESLYSFMMTRPDPQTFLTAALAACDQPAQALAASEAAGLVLAQARISLLRLRAGVQETLVLCRGEGGPAHYAQAIEQDGVLLASLLAALEGGWDALRGALAHARYTTLGRKKSGMVFDEDMAEAVKRRREAMKKELRALGEAFSASLEEAAEDLRMTRAPLAGLCELTRTYQALYAAAKAQRGLMDFDDLEHGALAALAHEDVRASLREKYRYIFIDEYQDSSAIQEAIIGRFAREDGLFLVGDVKQSIYRFRQAEPTLFLHKAAQYDAADTPHARRIDLQSNFRSRANVLNGVNAVFARIMHAEETEIEYDERERLIPGTPPREDDPALELHLLWKGQGETAQDGEDEDDLPDDDGQDERELAAVQREAQIAAARIRALVGQPYDDGKTGVRALRYADIAVLLRVAHAQAPLAAQVLAAQGIPVFCDAGEGYFDMPEIRTVMGLLAAIAGGAQDEALLAALRGPALGLSDEELAAIRMHTPDTRLTYREAARRYREEREDALAQKLRAFEARLARWRLCARHQGVDALIERIYAETGLLAHAGVLPAGAARQANLHLLVSRARAFMRAQGGSLHAFLRYAQRLRAGGDSMSASAITQSEDVVRIMTTHKSKGLEFPVVILLGLGRRMNTRGASARLLAHARLGVGLPCVDAALSSERDTLLRRAIRMQLQREQLAEEVRILYVGMTRAKERLILIGESGSMPDAWQQHGPGALSLMRTGLDMICPLLLHAGASLRLGEEEVVAGARWRVFAYASEALCAGEGRSQEAVLRLLAQLEAAAPDETLVRMLRFTPADTGAAVRKESVSSVIRDEKRAAQEEDYSEPMMRLPRFLQEQRMTGAQIGTVFHRMMRMLDLEALRAGGDLRAQVAQQAQAMREGGVISPAEYDAVPAAMLSRLFTLPLGARLLASAHVEREWAFTYRRTDGTGRVQLLQGMIDCCFEEAGGWVLLDYKTDARAQLADAADRHREQLALYAQALEAITGLPVRERLLYMVRTGTLIAV